MTERTSMFCSFPSGVSNTKAPTLTFRASLALLEDPPKHTKIVNLPVRIRCAKYPPKKARCCGDDIPIAVDETTANVLTVFRNRHEPREFSPSGFVAIRNPADVVGWYTLQSNKNNLYIQREIKS